jgi:hypothetical protein
VQAESEKYCRLTGEELPGVYVAMSAKTGLHLLTRKLILRIVEADEQLFPTK